MLKTTIDIINAALRSDPGVTAQQRAEILAFLRNPPKRVAPAAVAQPPRIISRAEVAKRLSCSMRLVDNLAVEVVLRNVTLPGRKRADEVREVDINALVGGDAWLDQGAAAGGAEQERCPRQG